MDNSYGIEKEKRVCKNCGANLPSQSNFCMHCGVNNDDVYGDLNAAPALPPPNINMDAEEGICKNCGKPIPSTGFCMHCGYNNNQTYGTKKENNSADEAEEKKYKFIEQPGKLSYSLFGIILVDLIIMLGSLLFQNSNFNLHDFNIISTGSILNSATKHTGTLGFLLIAICIGWAIFTLYKDQQESFGKKAFKTTGIYVIGYIIALIMSYIMQKVGFRINLLVKLFLAPLEQGIEIIAYAAFTVIIAELVITFLNLINLRNIYTYFGASIVAGLLLINLYLGNSAILLSFLFIVVTSWSFLCTDTKNVIIQEETNNFYAFLSAFLFLGMAVGVFVLCQFLDVKECFLGILVATILCCVVTFLKKKFVFKDFAAAGVLASICVFAPDCIQTVISMAFNLISAPGDEASEILFSLLLASVAVTFVMIIAFVIVGAVLGILLLVLHKVLDVICRKIHMNGILFKAAIAMIFVSFIVGVPFKFFNPVAEKVADVAVDLFFKFHEK